MAETALNFGPDWIRALATGSSSSAPTSMPIPRYSLAEFRYGREEMLALIPKEIKVPTSLQQYPHLLREKFQLPLALTTMTEEEQRLWSRSVNSEVALRASGKTGPGYGMRIGRGGSVDRGRGRGRLGSYYQRGSVHDESEEGSSGFSRPKVERSLSANEKDHRWDDRDRRYDRTFSGRGGVDDSNPKHDSARGPNDYWRKFDKDDDGDWRSSGFRSSDKGGRGSWRNNSERRDISERNSQNRNNSGNNRNVSSSQSKLGGHPSSWKDESQSNLPEWSVEETTEPDTVGTFDSSGAFLETKITGNRSLDEIYVSDDADEGPTKESPEAKKEPSKKTPKKSLNSENGKKTHKQSVKSPSEAVNVEENISVQSNSEPSKNSSKSTADTSIKNVIQMNTVTENQYSVQKEPDLLPSSQPNVPSDTVKTPKVKSVILTNVRNSENAMTTSGAEEDTFAYHQKATENMVAQWTEEIEEQRVTSHTDNIHPSHHEKDIKWFYQDPQGEIQGPFTSSEMLEWFSAGYFTMGLMVRRSCDEKFSQLGDLIKSWGRVPFMPGNSPPPIRVTPLTTSLPAPITQTIVPNPVTASTSAQLPKQDEQLLALQQQLFQQQIMQQQLMLRQTQLQQLLAQLKQQDNFTSLTQQQQQMVMQQVMAQQQMPRPNIKAMPETTNPLDSVGPLPFTLLGLSMPPMMKNDLSLWQTPPNSGTWPMNMSESQPPGGSIWDIDITKSNAEGSPAEKQKKLAEEQEKMRKAEELRLEQEREMEENRKQEEMRQKQEEMRILQELQKKEEERKRLEELQRQQEEEQRKEELKRLEEQRREEELRKQEELKRLEELRKQELQRLEELKKQEEQRQLEELKRKEEQQRLEELKKQELYKEAKRKKEEMQKLQMEKEQQKQLELERQKIALRLKELEREERVQKEKERKEKEEAEMRKLAELKLKSQGPAWGIQDSQATNEMSLADIQRLQEEKEREEREEKMRRQLLEQQTVKQTQQNKNGLSWAKRANECQPAVKSLAEIQQEEAERLAQANRIQKPPPPTPTVNMNAGAWGNTSHLSKITAAPSWNTSNASASGFWDDSPLYNNPARKPPQKNNNDSSAFPALTVPAQPATLSSNKSKNIRAKKEEDAVARLFGSHHKPTDEFTKWCTEAISAMPSSVDVPTFVAFLKDIESPYEVYDYVKSYFGEGKEPREFAKLFMEKRSKYRNQAKQIPAEDNTLWGPAPAITPVVNKTTLPSSTECDGNSNARGKSKKRKNRMQKLDSSMLGFTVQSNPDRLNVGEIDHIENM